MRTVTLVSLGASAVLGLGALVVAKVWLPQQGHNQGKTHAAAGPGVPVVVARGDIPYGARVDAARLQIADLPPAAVPQGAYSNIGQIVGQAGGPPVALMPIAAREPLLPAKLSGAGAKSTLAAMIADGMRGYTIGVNDIAGGGGHILPGDRVDVVLTYDLSGFAGASPSAGGSNGKRLISTVVLQDVRVLGMDLNADPSSTQATIAHTATLEVSMQDAERLALAAQAGSLSLALRRTGSAEIAPVRVVNVGDVGGVRVAPASRPHPFAAADRRHLAVRPTEADDRRAIVIVHGSTRADVTVPSDRGSGV